MPNDKTSRRGFLEIILGSAALATVGAVLYPTFKYITPPSVVEAKLSQLKLDFSRQDIEAESKKAKYFKYGRELGIILLTEKGKLKALSASCTHLDCTIQHRPDLQIIWCSCHNGRYGLDGKNISGPPPKPLESFTVKEIDGTIFVSKGDS